MNLGQIIERVDRQAPNAWEPEDKVDWLNEVERYIQTDVEHRQLRDMTDHVWSDSWSGTGVAFPNSATMTVPGRIRARAGGEIDVSDLTTYAGNNANGLTVLGAAYEDGVTTLTFAEFTFASTGDAGDAGTAKLDYSGYTEPMLAPEAWEKIYTAYLEARIASENREWGEYANALQIYNAFMAEFVRWYCMNFVDD